MKKLSFRGEFWFLYLIILLLMITTIVQFNRIKTLEGNCDIIREKYIELYEEVNK